MLHMIGQLQLPQRIQYSCLLMLLIQHKWDVLSQSIYTIILVDFLTIMFIHLLALNVKEMMLHLGCILNTLCCASIRCCMNHHMVGFHIFMLTLALKINKSRMYNIKVVFWELCAQFSFMFWLQLLDLVIAISLHLQALSYLIGLPTSNSRKSTLWCEVLLNPNLFDLPHRKSLMYVQVH